MSETQTVTIRTPRSGDANFRKSIAFLDGRARHSLLFEAHQPRQGRGDVQSTSRTKLKPCERIDVSPFLPGLRRLVPAGH